MDPRKRWICSSFTQPYCPLWLRNGGRTSNALLAAMLQMEENRPWSIKMKLDVSTALKSQGGGKKSFLLGHFVVVNWPEQLAIMQVMEPLFSFHLGGLCACQSKGRANELQLEVEIDSRGHWVSRADWTYWWAFGPPADRPVLNTLPAVVWDIFTFRHIN